MDTITAEELRDMCDSDQHHGFGFGVAYRMMTGAELAVAEKMVLARARFLNLDRDQLFLWLDSKNARWFCESVQSRNARAIQKLMTEDIIEGLVGEAADDLVTEVEAWLAGQ